MKLVVVGLSHHTAPLGVREKLAFGPTEVEEALRQLKRLPDIEEAALLSTCNRVEIYAAASSDGVAVGEVRSFLGTTRNVDVETLSRHLYEHVGEGAVRHLFRVASALDSMVLGESQILGQVKEAYGTAARAGTTGVWLSRWLERAFGVAKRVRSETKIAQGAASVSAVAVDLAQSIFGDLTGRSLLLVGAGKMSGLAARRLRNAGADEVIVTNRTLANAEALAREVEAKARPFDELDALLTRADVVITSTGSPEPILRRDRMAQIVKRRKHRPLFLVDIAVPRDVEPGVGELDNVFLYDVDDLEKVVAHNLAERRREAEVAERIIELEVKQFAQWMDGQGIVPTIKSLRSRADAIVQAELARVLPGLDERHRAKVQAMADAIVAKLLHAPTAAVRKDAELAQALRQLFELEERQTPPSPPAQPAAEPELALAGARKKDAP